MIEHDESDEIARVLAPLREEPPSQSNADAQSAQLALRSKVVPKLRAQVQQLHAERERSARTRQLRVVMLGGAVAAAAVAAAVSLMLRPGTLEERLAMPAPSAVPASAGLRVEGIAGQRATSDLAATWIDASGAPHAIESNGLGTLLPVGALELRARGSATRLRTAQGAEVELTPQTRLGVRTEHAGAEPSLRLLAGQIACAVPHLGPHKQFAIETPGARVVVHGTRFTVRVSEDAPAETCVRVSEGLVAVHHDGATEWLERGMAWGCDDPELSARKSSDQPERARSSRARVSRSERDKAERERERAGTLDAENRLLAEALSAERMHDLPRAHELFRALLRRHPDSPLALEAAAGLERTE